MTGDFNAKSKLWGNKYGNYADDLLENCLLEDNFICVNDCVNTRRNSESVIDLFIIKPHLNRNIMKCATLTHETVRSDHIAVLMDMADGTSDYSEAVERHQIYKTDWMKWDSVSSEKFTKWIEDSETSGNSDIEELCDSFTSVFKECTDDCVPKRKVNSDKKKTSTPMV